LQALPGKASRLQRAESANILQFQDFLYKQGKDGGYEAAGLLHTEIQNHLQEVYPESNVTDWNIVVQVICNLQVRRNENHVRLKLIGTLGIDLSFEQSRYH
jgi:hypothetical protein